MLSKKEMSGDLYQSGSKVRGRDSKGKALAVVPELTKTVSVESHLACFIEPETEDEVSLPPLPELLLQIKYDELDLSRIEAAYAADKDLLSLRNFLIGKKKGLDRNKCGFGLYCRANEDDQIVYTLQTEQSLWEKVKTQESCGISAKVKITGLSKHPINLEGVTGHGDLMFLFGRKVPFPVKKHMLENAIPIPEEDIPISFNFTISIEHSSILEAKLAPKRNLAFILQKMYDLPDSCKDLTIVAANGAKVKAHRDILMAQSAAFSSMLTPENKMTEAQSGRILMEQNSEEGLTQFVRCLYGFEFPIQTFSSELALEVFQISNKYGVQELEKYMKGLLTRKGMEWYSVDSILELYFYVKNNEGLEELRAHALTEMSQLPDEDLASSDYFKKLEREDERALLLQLLSWK